jgi:cellobiose-specific phosphotransferase system component IIC
MYVLPSHWISKIKIACKYTTPQKHHLLGEVILTTVALLCIMICWINPTISNLIFCPLSGKNEKKQPSTRGKSKKKEVKGR